MVSTQKLDTSAGRKQLHKSLESKRDVYPPIFSNFLMPYADPSGKESSGRKDTNSQNSPPRDPFAIRLPTFLRRRAKSQDDAIPSLDRWSTCQTISGEESEPSP